MDDTVAVSRTLSVSDICRFTTFVGAVASEISGAAYISHDAYCKFLELPSIAKQFLSPRGMKTLIVVNMESTSRKRSKWPQIEQRLFAWLAANATELSMKVTSEGQLLDETEDAVVGDLVVTDSIAIPIALAMLSLALRSFRQLLIAVLQLGLTVCLMFGVLGLVSQSVEISSFAPEGASACIVALSIDYVLFFGSRFNELVRMALLDGVDLLHDEEAQYVLVRRCLQLCAHNIVVSGFAISISLGSLIIMPVQLISTVGIAFTVGSVSAVLVAMTFSPAITLAFFNFFAIDHGFNSLCARLPFGAFFLDDVDGDAGMGAPVHQLLGERLDSERELNDASAVPRGDLEYRRVHDGATTRTAIQLQPVRGGGGAARATASAAVASVAQRREADRLELLADVRAQEAHRDAAATASAAAGTTAAGAAGAQDDGSYTPVVAGGDSGGEVDRMDVQQQQQQQHSARSDLVTPPTSGASLARQQQQQEQQHGAAASAPPTSGKSHTQHHHHHAGADGDVDAASMSPVAESILSSEAYEEHLSPSVARRHQLARRSQYASPWFRAGRFAVDNSCAVVIAVLLLMVPFLASVSLMDVTFDLFAQVPRGSEKAKILDEVLTELGGAISAPFFVAIDTGVAGGLGSPYRGNLSADLTSITDIGQLASALFKNFEQQQGGKSSPSSTPSSGSNINGSSRWIGNFTGNMTNSSSLATRDDGGWNQTVFQVVQQFAVYIAGRTGIDLDRITSFTTFSGVGLGFNAYLADALVACARAKGNGLPKPGSAPVGDDARYKQLIDGCSSYNALVNRTVDPSYRLALLIVAPPFDAFGNKANQFLNKLDAACTEFNERQSLFRAGFFGGSATDWAILHALIQETPLQVGLTLGVIFVVVAVNFKSVFVPLRMLFTIAVSLVFSFGVGVALFQTPKLREVLWGENGPGALTWLIPTFALSLLVSLSLDYDIFAMTRIYEYRALGFNARAATIKAVTKSGRVISYAAGIMAVSFLSMLFSRSMALQQFAILASVAVLCDAFIVRVFLTPALTTLQIPGEACWWPTQFPSADRDVEDMTEAN